MPLYRDMPYSELPVAYSLQYATQSARLAASGLTSSDIGRIARQLDTGDFYILLNHSPVTWAFVGVPITAASYYHVQSSPATTWVINHNLGYYPSLEVRNTGGIVIGGRVQHVSLNQTTVTFNIALAGTARAN